MAGNQQIACANGRSSTPVKSVKQLLDFNFSTSSIIIYIIVQLLPNDLFCCAPVEDGTLVPHQDSAERKVPCYKLIFNPHQFDPTL